MLIDTHAHLDYPDFADDFSEVLRRARDNGVTRIITIGTGVESSKRAVALAEQHPEVFATVGVHPSHVLDEPEDFVDSLRTLASHPRVVAIGEAGLDYHRLPSTEKSTLPAMAALGASTPESLEAGLADGAIKSAQAEAFRAQLDLAADLGLNLVVHQRDAWQDTLEIIQAYTGKVRGVFHCFGGTPDQAADLIALGHCISFTGILTFKNAATVRETAASLPPGTFMVETDCPYLAPDPYRGARCEPWHTALVAAKLADLRRTDPAALAQETTATAEKFFRFPA